MAIDTQAKRLSALSIGLPWNRTLPTADGEFDQPDRQHWLRLYSGVLADEAGAPTEPGIQLAMSDERSHLVMDDERKHFRMPNERPHVRLTELD